MTNLIGMNLMLWTAAPDIDEHAVHLDKLKSWGYGAFEVAVGGLDARQIAGFARKATELDLVPKAMDLYTVAEGDLIGENPGERARAIERIKESIHKARDLGSHLLSGPIYQGLGRSTASGATAEEWKRAVEGLHSCAVEAEECGVRIAAEPLNRFEMYIVNTIEQAHKLCEEVGVSSMGILADTHHSNIEEANLLESYVTYADRIHAVHVAENHRGILGTGHAIPRELFTCMRAAGYEGDWVIEAFNANVEELKPLVRVFAPFAETEDEVAVRGLQFIAANL